MKSLQTLCRKEFRLGYIDVGVADQVVLYYSGDLLLFDAARGVVRCSVLGNCGPVPRLESSQTTLHTGFAFQ